MFAGIPACLRSVCAVICLRMFTHVYATFTQCLRNVYAMFTQICFCLHNAVICVNIATFFTCLRMFTHVYACLRMFTQTLRKRNYVYAVFTHVYACLRRLRKGQLADDIPARLSPSSRPAQSPGMPPTHIPTTLVLARLCPIGPACLHPIRPARWAYAPSSGTPPPLIPARSKSESRHASAPHPARLPHRSGSPLPHLPGTLPPSDRHTSAPHTCAPPGPRPDPPPPLGPVCLRSSARL
jgi:hypothetical protein